MTAEWRASVAKVSTPSVTGTAFVVGARRLVTCRHNLHDMAPDGVRVHFPLHGEKLMARPIERYCDGTLDIAVLEASADLPAEARPLRWSRHHRGARFTTLGFSQSAIEGLLATGSVIDTILARDGVRLLQLGDSNTVTSGFSGAPVVEDDTGLVVGMISLITNVDDDGRGLFTTVALPTEEAESVYPDLLSRPLNPYKGLGTFQESDAELFHGRDRALAQLLDAFRGNPAAITLLGPSGCGKSSLVRAGLVPALARGFRGHRPQQTVVWLPQDLLARYRRSGEPSPGALEHLVREHLWRFPALDRLVVAVDQFEELLRPGDPIALHVLAELERIAGMDGRVTLLSIARDDFYSQIASTAPRLVDGATGLAVNLSSRLSESEVRSIIQAPADRVGLAIEPGIAHRIAAEFLEPGRQDMPASSLPLLEVALTEIHGRSDGYTLRTGDLQGIADVTSALTHWCERALASLGDSDQLVARWCFISLVNPGREHDAVPASRRRRTMSQLADDVSLMSDQLVSLRRVEAIASTLAQHRILTLSSTKDQEQQSCGGGRTTHWCIWRMTP